ncbi:unnamed protein product [Heligmosomoides polygyrus]|uniref:Pkinase_Tyr domain-containing protein n=1 Tax=Heligmosomoides polygyrus TaxID=6339 RepID=A0A183FT23_HELPZ|nr:unnamed protein product [Heligmosomoides polygyrus]
MKTVLSARWNGKNHHFVVNEGDGKVMIDKVRFANVYDMIRYYMQEKKPVTESIGAILKAPVPRQDWELKHESVAVKVSKSQTVTKRIITEICKEARIMRSYRHRNVVKFYGVAVDRVAGTGKAFCCEE